MSARVCAGNHPASGVGSAARCPAWPGVIPTWPAIGARERAARVPRTTSGAGVLAFIAVLVGGLLGALGSESFFGALVGAALGWLGVRSWRQQREIVTLRQDLKRQATAPATAALPAMLPPQVPAAAVPEVDAEPIAATEGLPAAPDLPVVAARDTEAPAEPRAAVDMPPVMPPAPPRPGALEPLRQWLFGGNTIVKAGGGILFLGLALPATP